MSKKNSKETNPEWKMITRRKILISAGSSGAIMGFSGIASADSPPNENSWNKSDDLPGLKDDSVTTENIHEKDPEEIFDEEILEMSADELDRLVKQRWNDGYGSHKLGMSNVDENCIAETLNLDELPAIDFDLCLIDDNCAVEFTAGALGQSTSEILETCPHIVRCKTVHYNLLSDLLDIEVCFNVNTLEVSLDIEYCNWRPGQGWNCTSDSWSYYF